MYVNNEKFESTKYGDDAILRESIFIQENIDEKQPSYFEL